MSLGRMLFLLVLSSTLRVLLSNAQTFPVVGDSPLASSIPVGTGALPSKGLVTDHELVGYLGTTYHSIRFEPICGTLGPHPTLYAREFDRGDRCKTTMASFSKEKSTVALYDQSGVKVEGDLIGNQAICLCFTLADLSERKKGDICLFFNDQGQAETIYYLGTTNNGYFLTSTFRPNQDSKQPLPQCANVDLAALSEAWSATAIVNGQTAPNNIRPQATRTFTSVSTVTDSAGRPTSTVTYVYVEKLGEDDNTGPLSRSDTIALGTGLGLGIPSLILAIVGVVAKVRRNRAQQSQSDQASSNPWPNTAPSNTSQGPPNALTPSGAQNSKPYSPHSGTGAQQNLAQHPQWLSGSLAAPITQSPRPYTHGDIRLNTLPLHSPQPLVTNLYHPPRF